MTTEDLEREIILLRDKSHKLSNFVVEHESRILSLEEDMERTNKVMNAVRDSLLVIEGQGKLLKWLIGVATAILVSVITKGL